MQASQIDDYVLPRLRTTDQQVTGGRFIERFGPITHRTGNQAALAVMANASTARPTHWNIAGFRELEQILVFCIPPDRDAATCERDLRPLPRGSCGQVGGALWFSRYTRRQRFTGPKDFLMHSLAGNAPGGKTSS